MPASRTLHVALPAMNEAAFLPQTMECLQKQEHNNFQVWVCVNQPESWWNDPEKRDICENNRQTLFYLRSLGWKNLHIINNSSPDQGWKGKALGVGLARKVIMDTINKVAQAHDIIVSLDADTLIEPDYLKSVQEVFERFPTAVALSNPYYHPVTGQETLDRAMLRYEIYMRHYALNMWRIDSPYSFTALGSAIALPVSSYRKIGGITAKKSGEDFYLLQKLRKAGWIATFNKSHVFPGTRYSDRVFFGTGPALIKGSTGNWESYPIYNYRLFDHVEETYSLFPKLFEKKMETPMTEFLNQHFGEDDIFEPLRKNHKNPGPFIKACHHKVDGLRVLQYLKHHQTLETYSDEENLLAFLKKFFPDFFIKFELGQKTLLDFRTSPLALLNGIRNYLMEKEHIYQENDRP
jgi:glycosyltransferase involved in cell wall biosynthesis